MNAIVRPLVAASLVALTASVVAVPATAQQSPAARVAATVTLTPASTRIDAESKAKFTYFSTHVPVAATMKLQRQVGTAHVWRTVGTAQGRSGQITSKQVPMGRALFRLVAATNRAGTIATSKTTSVFSYGKVPISRICRQDSWGGGCARGNVDVNGQLFTYSAYAYPFYSPDYRTIWSKVKTSCRLIHLQVVGNPDAGADDNLYVRIIQSAADPLNTAFAAGTIGAVDKGIRRGGFQLEMSSDDADTTYVSGYAECWTPNGAFAR